MSFHLKKKIGLSLPYNNRKEDRIIILIKNYKLSLKGVLKQQIQPNLHHNYQKNLNAQ